MLFLTNFDSFAITIVAKFHFPIEIVLNLFGNTKGPGTSFQVAVFVKKFSLKSFLL